MPAATSSNRLVEVESFLDTLFEGQEGFVYAPTLTKAGNFQQYFFQWPENREAIATHIIDQTSSVDVYLSPSLFKTAANAKKENWKGTYYTWVEFDGNAPKDLPNDIPEPTIRIQSSEKNHQHWYWRLSDFETDFNVVDGLSRKLTYALEADLSGWDATQVLRPPGTLHHESRRRVRLLTSKSNTYGLESFASVVEPPAPVVIDSNFDELPDVQDVVSKYKWDKETFALFKKKVEHPHRSSAMTRLAFSCTEMGMTNEEIYSILLNVDDRWGKFAKRPVADRAKRLIGIITYVRSQKALQSELLLAEKEPIYTLGDFLETEIHVDWVFKDLLMETGLGIISGQPSAGKSTFSLQLGLHAITGIDFLLWKCLKEDVKLGFCSFEMGSAECKFFLNFMLAGYTPEQQAKIRKNFIIYPLGYQLALDRKPNQDTVLEMIDTYELDFLIIDSLKAATGGLQEDKLDKFFDFINRDVRSARKCSVWIVHHNRKPQGDGPRKPRGLEDLYGDQYIAAHATAVLTLWRTGKNTIDVLNFKTRLAEETDPFKVRRTPEFDFEIIEEEPENDPGTMFSTGGKEDKGDTSRSGIKL